MGIKDKLSKYITITEDPISQENEGYDDYEEDDEEAYEPAPRFDPRGFKSSKNDPKVVNINQGKRFMVRIIKPQEFRDVRNIAGYLKVGEAVSVNLESVSGDTARRMLDFMSGVVTALDGTMCQSGNGVFTLAPKGVEVVGEGYGDLSNGGNND